MHAAMNGMRSGSRDFSDFLAEVATGEMGMKRGVYELNLFVSEHSSVRMVSHVDDPISAGSDAELSAFWKELHNHAMLRRGDRLSVDRPMKYLGRVFFKLHEGGRRGVRVRHPEAYMESFLEAVGVRRGCKGVGVPGAGARGPRRRV